MLTNVIEYECIAPDCNKTHEIHVSVPPAPGDERVVNNAATTILSRLVYNGIVDVRIMRDVAGERRRDITLDIAMDKLEELLMRELLGDN